MAPGHIYLSTSLVLYLHTCSSVCRVAGDNSNGQKKIACGGVRRVLRVRPFVAGPRRTGASGIMFCTELNEFASLWSNRTRRRSWRTGTCATSRQAAPGGRPGCLKLYLLYNFPMSIVIRALDKSLQLRATC